jgi:hypothetical protein
MLDHERWLSAHPRTALMARNAGRLSPDERGNVLDRSSAMLAGLDRR